MAVSAHLIDSIFDNGFYLLLDAAIKGSIVLGLIVLMLFCMRRSAAVRHFLWLIGLCSFVVIPALTFALPHRPIAFSSPWQTSATAVHENSPPLETMSRAINPAPIGDQFRVASKQEGTLPAALTSSGKQDDDSSENSRVAQTSYAANASLASRATAPATWSTYQIKHGVLLLWSLVVVFFLCRLLLGWISLCRLRKTSCKIDSGPLYETMQSLAKRINLRRGVTLLQNTKRSMPMTWGLRQAVILLPAEADDWSEERLQMVLRHELAHIKRRDCISQLLAYLVRAVYWFNPLVWLAVAQLRREQERACDDVVLQSGAKPSSYAAQLLSLSTSLPANVLLTPLALAVSRAVRLQNRIRFLLEERANREPLTRRIVTLLSLAALVLFVVVAPIQLQWSQAAEQQPEPEATVTNTGSPFETRLAEVREVLMKRYIKELDEKQLAADAIKGIMAGLNDPYGGYLDAETMSAFNKSYQGKLAGIGVRLRMNQGRLTVVSPLANTPAFKAGLRPGDVITAIDGKKNKDLSLKQNLKLMRGPAGSKLKLTVQRTDGTSETVEITRDVLRIPSLQGLQRGQDWKWVWMLDPVHKIGYIRVSQFSERTSGELTATIKALQQQGMKGLLLDLRFCPGGLMQQAIESVDRFQSKGVIISVKTRGDPKKTWKAKADTTLGDFPLVVLINNATASAAEIVAGALQDNERAIILGTRSFGKASVQSLVKLKDGGALKLTTSYYLLPKGRNLQKKPGSTAWGVDPDDGFYVPMTEQQLSRMHAVKQTQQILDPKQPPPEPEKISAAILDRMFSDPQLAAALRTMTAKIAGGEFIKVGQSKKDLLKQIKDLKLLQKEQQDLRQQLRDVEQRIAELEDLFGNKRK